MTGRRFRAAPGRLLLLWWFPRARTPGCSAQALDLSLHVDVLEEDGLDVVGLSLDPQDVLDAWEIELELPFLLVSVDLPTAESYGAARPADDPWREHLARRVAVVVDEDGETRLHLEIHNPHGFTAQLREALASLE